MRARYARAIRGGIVCARDADLGRWGMQGWMLTADGALALRAYARETERIRSRDRMSLASDTLWRNHKWLANVIANGQVPND